MDGAWIYIRWELVIFAILAFLSPLLKGFPGGSDGKVSVRNAGDLDLNPESGRSPGEGNGSPFQVFLLENPMDKGVWRATVHGITKSWT